MPKYAVEAMYLFSFPSLKSVLLQMDAFRNEHMRRSSTIVYDYLDMLNTWGMWVQRARLICILGWKQNNFSTERRMNQNTEQACFLD